MPSVNWTLSDNQTLAEYVPVEDFKGLLQQRIGISPDHVALLMRDGQIVDTFVGGHFAIGGVWQRLKEAIGGQHAVRLLVADLKPFQIEGEVEGISSDGVPIAATVAIELQVNPEKPANVLGLMRERGVLAKPDVYQRVLPHLRDRVFANVIGRVKASELRGNAAVQDKVQAELLHETERIFKDLGVIVRAASVTWALNDAERAAMERSASERDQAMLDYQLETKKREVQREKETTEFTLRADTDVEKLKATSEDGLKHLFLKQELDFIDARQAGVRAQELKQLDHELTLLNTQRRAGYEKALEDAKNEADRAAIRKQLTALDLEIDAMKQTHRLQIARLEEEQKLAIAAEARRHQMSSLREIDTIELDRAERERRLDREDRTLDVDLSLRTKQQDSQHEMERLRLQAQMSPDQILAISAGLSPDVARVFAERARGSSIDADRREALLREMVQLASQGRMASEEQAKFFFDKAMGATAGRPAAPPAGDAAATIECPNCHRTPPASDRFCRHCGHALRT
jgi:hypothetical protein